MPRSEPHGSRVTLSTRFLVLGMVASVLLAVPTAVLPLAALTRIQRTALELADDSQQTTFYLGEVAEQLARLRVRALQPGTPDEVTRIDRRLQAAVEALPGSIDSPARQRWAELEPEVERLRRVYEDARAATLAGRPAGGAALLAMESSATTRMHDVLSEVIQAHRDSVLARLRAAHREASWVSTVELALGGVFLTGLIAIWAIMLGTLRRQRRQLVEYTARLESANEDLDAFAGRVAHDLRNALGPIVLAPEMLRQAQADPAAVLRIAARTERCSLRAVAMMDALLAFSKGARAVDANEAGALQPAVKSVLEELAPRIAQLDVSVEAAELPDVRVRCSPGLLHIVLANLCGNAVKYLEGRAERRVRISATIDGAGCRIQVEDTGPGIPKEAQGQIFEPFYRVPDSRASGLGIGLATARRIVDARGGRIEVESELGRGSCFRVWLPLAPEAPSA